jgi:hypothetical protein
VPPAPQNLLEELDWPGEVSRRARACTQWFTPPPRPLPAHAHVQWYYGADTGRLYVWYNATTPAPTAPPTDGTLVLATLETLVAVNGSTGTLVTNVTLAGLSLTVSQPTFLARPFKAPSGGDWSFADTAAVVLEGTQNVAIDHCDLRGLGGNAVLIRGLNQGARVTNSSFHGIGDSAIVTCGDANLADITAGACRGGGGRGMRCIATFNAPPPLSGQAWRPPTP